MWRACCSRRRAASVKAACMSNALLSLTMGSVVVGVLLGFLLRPFSLSQEALQLINFPGEIFMQVLKLMILPLIFSSLISALAQMDAKESGQMGLATTCYYLTTAILATVLGIVLVVSIHPGDPNAKPGPDVPEPVEGEISSLDSLLDLIRNMFPPSLIKATFMRVQTVYERRQRAWIKPNASESERYVMVKIVSDAPGMNILGILVFCTGFGIVMSQLGERARIVVEFFVILDAAIMRWVTGLMWFAPLGIVCMIAANLLEVDDMSEVVTVLVMYLFTVLSGLLIHTVVVMPLLYFLITRKNPLHIVSGMLQSLVTAFGTASSGAALPLSMQCLEENVGIDRRVTRFVLPLGTTINMDGNALYEAVAVIFIAQLNNVSLSIGEIFTVSLTATIASIGLGSVPAGLVSILLILSTVGLPAKDVSLIITVDWLLDRVRTAVNVLGDGFAAGAVAHLIGRRISETDERVNEFRAEIRDEIRELNSRTNSQRPSIAAWSETESRELFLNMSAEGGGGVLSRKHSTATPFSLSWRSPSFAVQPLPLQTHIH